VREIFLGPLPNSKSSPFGRASALAVADRSLARLALSRFPVQIPLLE